MSDFRVQGRLGLDGSGFFSTLGKAQGAVGAFGSALAGAFSVGAITAFSKSVLDLAGRLNDVSDALAINVEFLQKFINSAAKSGGGIGDLEKFLFESNKARQAALDNPTGKEAGAFAQLGFTTSDIQSATSQQLIEKIIKAMADGATPQELNALAEIGGKSAKKLVGGFKDGLDESTGIMAKELVSQLDEIGDRFTSLATSLKTGFAPIILWVIKSIQAAVDIFSAGKAYYSELISTGSIGKAGEALTAELLKQAEDDKKRAAAQADRKTMKASAETAPAGFAAKTTAEEAFKTGGFATKSGDSLLSVGNFLGSGGVASLSSIAQRSLEIQTQHLAVSRSLLTAFGSKGDTLVIGI